ncbi:MAG: cupin domain-containing protein [Bacteroidota bacterium]|nr:cupin domain-containing protein [Bacteroidota bacterium]
MKPKEFDKAKKFQFDASVEYAEGSIVSKNVLKNEAGNVSLFAFDKDEGLSEHTAPFDALVQVIDGKADVIINGKTHILESGDSIIMPASVPHALRAAERFKMILTMIKG